VYLQTNNILIPEQFGFSKGISTENAAIKLTDRASESINQKNACWWNILCFGLSLSLSLSLYLFLYNKYIQGATASWFRFYLTDRKQKIEIKSSNLTQVPTQTGEQ
jgi:hypothetical protein